MKRHWHRNGKNRWSERKRECHREREKAFQVDRDKVRDNDRIQTLEKSVCVCVVLGLIFIIMGQVCMTLVTLLSWRLPVKTGIKESLRAKHMGHRSIFLNTQRFWPFVGCYGCRLWPCLVLTQARERNLVHWKQRKRRIWHWVKTQTVFKLTYTSMSV